MGAGWGTWRSSLELGRGRNCLGGVIKDEREGAEEKRAMIVIDENVPP